MNGHKAKTEFLNPGGSVKDRVALSIIRHAEESGQLRAGGTVYEGKLSAIGSSGISSGRCLFIGTAGSTGISLAMVARARGYKCHICIPDDQVIIG